MPQNGHALFLCPAPERFPCRSIEIRNGKIAPDIGLALQQLDAVAACGQQRPGLRDQIFAQRRRISLVEKPGAAFQPSHHIDSSLRMHCFVIKRIRHGGAYAHLRNARQRTGPDAVALPHRVKGRTMGIRIVHMRIEQLQWYPSR